MAIDAYQMATDRICEIMEQGIIPWKKPWNGASTWAWSGNDGHSYSFLNQMLLLDPKKKYQSMDDVSKDIATEWITYQMAKDRGGHVREGEKGRKIIFFSMVPVKDENGEKTEELRPCIKMSTVFKVSQCEGVDQKFRNDDKEEHEFIRNKTADDIADGYATREGIKINTVKGNRAFYSPADDAITIPLPEQFRDPAEYYSTLFHELTHSTGHEKRLNRIKSSSFGDHDYSTEELVAEIGSASICCTLGIESDGSMKNSAAYVQNWLKALRNDKKMIVNAAARAEKAIRMIFGIEKGALDHVSC